MDTQTKKADANMVSQIPNEKTSTSIQGFIKYPEEIKGDHTKRLLKRYAKQKKTI